MIIKSKYIILFLFGCLTRLNINARTYETLKDLVDRIASDKEYCKMLKIKEPALLSAFYNNNHYQLQWYSSINDASKRINLLRLITPAYRFMLDPNDYIAVSILNKKCLTRKDSLLSEIRMTDMALYFLEDIVYSHRQFVKYNGWHYYPDCLDIPWLLQQSIQSNDFEKYVHDSEPESAEYQKLKALYLKVCDSIRYFAHNDFIASENKRVQKIRNAIQWYRWMTCMQNKSYIVINVASGKLSYMECNETLFTCSSAPGKISFGDYSLTSSMKNILMYYDGNYPATLEFNFINPFNVALSSMDPCIPRDPRINLIGIENPNRLAEILGIDNAKIYNSVCPEEATPFATLPVRSIPIFIVNVPMDF